MVTPSIVKCPCRQILARQTQEETVSLPCTSIKTLLYLMTRTGTSVLADLQSVNRMESWVCAINGTDQKRCTPLLQQKMVSTGRLGI